MTETRSTLELLVRRYASAPFGFFGIRNYAAAQEQFLADDTSEPAFTYSHLLTLPYMEHRKADLARDRAGLVADAHDERVRFIERRSLETEYLLALIQLRVQPADERAYQTYRELVTRLYGDFDPTLLAGIVHYLQQRAEATGQESYFAALQNMLQMSAIVAGQLYRPADETFRYYKELLLGGDTIFHALLQQPFVSSPMIEQTMVYLTWGLQMLGAAQSGWQVREDSYASNVRISRFKHEVVVGKYHQPRSARRMQQMVAHEIFVHVARSLHSRFASNDVSEEGVALVVEQLLAHRFMYRRMLRYLAAAVAWGVDGQPRTFRETFEIVWRAFCIVGQHDEQLAKRYAFSEVARIFRGGVPQLAGAAYTKDKTYFEANLTIWQQLEHTRLDQETFLGFIQGTKPL